MSTYRQSRKLVDVRYDVRGPNMVEAQRLEAAGHRIMKLNIGNLAPWGFEAPDAILTDVVSNLRNAQGYSDSRGIRSARIAVANYYQLHGLTSVTIDEVFIGNGVSELISMVLQAMLDDGDEVLVPTPDYPLWTAAVNLSGGKPVHYLCDEENEWNPDVADIRAKITPSTKALVIINPNNPTGAVYSREILTELVQVAEEHNLILLSDEIYEKILFGDAVHQHTAALAGPNTLCFTFSGLSKAYRVCGFRSGWVVVTGPLAEAQDLLEGITLLANMRMCANVPAQYAIQTALGGYQSIDELIGPEGRFRRQNELAHELLTKIPGVSCVPAKGALYLFPKLDPDVYPISDDELFARELLHSKHMLVSHGTGFNWIAPDHLRVVTLPREEILADAIERLADFLAEYRAR